MDIIDFGTDIDKIRDFNTYINEKISQGEILDESDYQNLSLSHRQNAGKALSAQLVYDCGYSQAKADSIAHSSCKAITTYLQLRVEGVPLTYAEYWKMGCKNGWFRERDAWMNVQSDVIISNFKNMYDEVITVNIIEKWDDFIKSDVPYGQLRINVVDGDGSYSHSLPCYRIDGNVPRRLADVSYRKQGADVLDLIRPKDFKYFLYLV